MKEKIITIPNTISFLRLPLAFLTIFSYLYWYKYLFLFTGLFFDFLDGFLARKLNQTTKIGAILDPLFDKLFNLIIFSFFFYQLNLNPGYLLLFFFRDIVTSIGVIIILFKGIKVDVKARMIGKIVTVFQFITLILMVALLENFAKIGILLTFIISLISIIDYMYFISKNQRPNHPNGGYELL